MLETKGEKFLGSSGPRHATEAENNKEEEEKENVPVQKR